MNTPRILRSRKNPHRYYYFVGQKSTTFTTDADNPLAKLGGVDVPPWKNLQSGMMKACAFLLFAMAALGYESAAFADGLPTGYNSVSGNVQFQQQGNTLNVSTQAQKSIANYQTFNIGQGNTVNFNLPGRQAMILNRVTGGNPSSIMGKLNSNGQVWLVNPSGILFGATAQVNVGGLLATTMNIRNEDFLSGNYKFFQDGPGASVINHGTLSATDYLAMFGGGIQNTGTMQAPQVNLAVGEKVTMKVSPDVAIQVTVDEALKQKVDGLASAIENSGNIHAHTASLQAHLEKNVMAELVNNSGIIEAAQVVDGPGGSIEIVARGGNIVNSGTLDVSTTQGDAGSIRIDGDADVHNTGDLLAMASDDAGLGGEITVTGEHITLAGESLIDASGGAGGGHIRIGGDYQGGGDLPTAQTLTVGEDVSIKADALHDGDGGRVILWSDDTTTFLGNLSIRGGNEGGDGGFAEVSGKKYLNYLGLTDARAPKGKTGLLLLDPEDYEINLGNVGAINNAMANVLLQATQDIFVNAQINMVNVDVSLTLEADRHVAVNQSITTLGDLSLIADANNNGTGTVTLNTSLNSNNNDILLSGANLQIDNAVNAGAGQVTLEVSEGQTGFRSIAGDGTERAWNLSGVEMSRISADSVLVDGSKSTGHIYVYGDILLDDLGYNLTVKNRGAITLGIDNPPELTLDRGEKIFNLESTHSGITLTSTENLILNLSDLTAESVLLRTHSNEDMRFGDITTTNGNLSLFLYGDGNFYLGNLQSSGNVNFNNSGVVSTAFVNGNINAGGEISMITNVAMIGEGRSLTDGDRLTIFANRTLSADHDLTINTFQPNYGGRIDVGDNTLTFNVLGTEPRKIATSDPNFSADGWNLNTGEMSRITAGSVLIDGSNTAGTMNLQGNILLNNLEYNLTLKNQGDILAGSHNGLQDINLRQGENHTLNLESTEGEISLRGEGGMNILLHNLTAPSLISLEGHDIQSTGTFTTGSLSLSTVNGNAGSSEQFLTTDVKTLGGNIEGNLFLSNQGNLSLSGDGMSITGDATLNVDGSFTIVDEALISDGNINLTAHGPIRSKNGDSLDIKAKQMTLTSTHGFIGEVGANQLNVQASDGPITLSIGGANTDGVMGSLWGSVSPPPNFPKVSRSIYDKVFWNGVRMTLVDPLPSPPSPSPAPSPAPSPRSNNIGQKLEQEVPWSPVNVLQSTEPPPKAPPQSTADIQDQSNGQGTGGVQIQNNMQENPMEDPNGIIQQQQQSSNTPKLTAPDEQEEFTEGMGPGSYSSSLAGPVMVGGATPQMSDNEIQSLETFTIIGTDTKIPR